MGKIIKNIFGGGKAPRVSAPAAPKRENRQGQSQQFDPENARKRKKRRGQSSSILASARSTLG